MAHNRGRVSRVVTIGVGTAYWLHQTLKVRSCVWWLWFVVAQGRRACLHRDYLVGVGGEKMRSGYAATTTPMLSISFTDDEYMSARNNARMHAFYANAPRDMRRIAPQDVGAQRMGHLGFFRQKFSGTLWPQLTQWLAPPQRDVAR